MKKQKYYAVKNGRKTGIFTSWTECEKQVKGYADAKFESFSTMDDAQNYLNNLVPKASDSKTKNIENIVMNNDRTMEAYVDGSFDSDTYSYSCGVVCLIRGKEFTFSEVGNDPDMSEMRNVAGELMGAIRAMAFAIKNLDIIDTLIIYHDYEGIAKWCTGEWKAKKKGTQEYKSYYDRAIKKININFVKVKAHSGIRYNEMADELASSAFKLKSKEANHVESVITLIDDRESVQAANEIVKSQKPLLTIRTTTSMLSFRYEELISDIKKDWKRISKKNISDIIDFKIDISVEEKSCTYYIETKENELYTSKIKFE